MKKDQPETVAVPVIASFEFSDGLRQLTLALEARHGMDRMQSILAMLYAVGLTLAAHELPVLPDDTIVGLLPSLLKGYDEGVAARKDLSQSAPGLH